MNITVNGTPQVLLADLTVLAFLEHQGINPLTVIVERNQAILKREQWATVLVTDGDTLEIIRFMAGG